LQRFYANPETREKARQRHRFLVDHNLGMSASRAEGEARGEVKGKAGIISRLLTRRFGAVPQTLEEKLHVLNNIDKLDRLADLVLDCQSLEEFERGVE